MTSIGSSDKAISMPAQLRFEISKTLPKKQGIDVFLNALIPSHDQNIPIIERMQTCVKFWVAACRDDKWINNNPDLMEKFYWRLIKFEKEENSIALSSGLSNYLEIHKNALVSLKRFKNDDLKIIVGDLHISASKQLLSECSDVFEMMLNAGMKEQRAFEAGQEIPINCPHPNLFVHLIKALESRKLPAGLSVDDLILLSNYAQVYKVGYAILPLISDSLIKSQDFPKICSNLQAASDLYQFAVENNLNHLQREIFLRIEKSIDEEQCFDLLEAEVAEGGSASADNFKNAAFRCLLTKLPGYLKCINSAPTSSSSQTPEQAQALEKINKIIEHLPKLNHLKVSIFYMLDKHDRDWLLSKLPEKLTYLNLSHLSDEQLPDLSRFKNLGVLDLSHSVHLKSIEQVKNFKHLQFLVLSGCHRLQDITAVSHLNELVELNITDCWELNEERLRFLKEWDHLPKMKFTYNPRVMERIFTKIYGARGLAIKKIDKTFV